MMVHRGTSRPLRAGGLLLLGVAAVAAVIGTASAVSGDGSPQSAPPPEEPTSSEPAGDGEPTTTKPSPTTSSTEPAESTTTTTERPSSSRTTKPAAGDGGDKGSVKAVSVRVYNNSTVKGLAGRAAEDLRADGWNVVETGNYSGGRIYTTTAYYRPGTGEKAAAEAIGAEFGMRVAPRFAGIADSSPGVIVIVTKDYSGAK